MNFGSFVVQFQSYSLGSHNFQLDDYITDLSVAMQELLYNQDPNTHFNAFLNKFLTCINKHLPMKKTLECKTTNPNLG